MFYKLSNTATLEEIEQVFNATFEFPKLYNPSKIINGLEESILPIITMDKPDKVGFGIWGLLPEELKDNWKVYQNLTNTLNINIEQLDSKDSLYSKAFDNRRCIIIITGFFTSAMHNGRMFPHHVYLKDHKPFGIAAVYNQLEDGFITCSILIDKTTNKTVKIPNILLYEPVVFDLKDQFHWLNKSLKYDDLKDLVSSHQSLEYLSHPVSKEFYDNDIQYSRVIKSQKFNDFLKST
jgi:putative SOS response-associated peptidase YedK